MRQVTLYDTTLRDGTQGEGISLSVEDKLKITKRLDRLGIQFIEGGYPGSNPKDMEYFQRLSELTLRQATVVAFTSTRRPNLAVEEDKNIAALLSSGVTAVTLFGKSWDFHVTSALKTTLEENLDMIRDTISYLKRQGLRVFYDAEHFFDAYKANPEYALTTIRTAQAAGAETIVLCDTNGGSIPSFIQETVAKVVAELEVPVGIHAHNDSELAVANSLVAIEAGASQVQGTINGYGERCGNANLCSIIPNLVLKMDIQCISQENLYWLTDLSRYVSELANLHHNAQQPYVGKSAFAHKGGMHVSALLKDPSTYEHINPQLVGNQRRVLVSELSGMSNVLYKAEEMGIDTSTMNKDTQRILTDIKHLEHQGYQFEGAEGSFELMMRKAFNQKPDFFELENLRIIYEMREGELDSEAVIKVRVGDQIVHTAAEGNGPVNAMDNALRKALTNFYPSLQDMSLSDFKVRVIDEKSGTGALVRVLIETGKGTKTWGTVGVSGNIIEASWQALVDSVVYGLLLEQKAQEPEVDEDDWY